MDDDDKYDPTKYLRDVTPPRDTPPPAPAATDQAGLLPGLNSPYKAASTVDGEVTRLVVIMGRDGFRIGSTAYFTLQYAHIGTGEFGFTANGQVFRYPFFDYQPKLLTVHGRNVLRIYHHIGLKRMGWIRMTDRDFTLVGDEADEPVITRVEVTNWKRPKEEHETAMAEEFLSG
jgi:hypothetical protein